MRELYFVLKVAMWMLWPLTAFAANASFGSALFKTDPQAISMALMLSSLSGLTALLSQMKKDYEAHGKIDRLWLYVTSKMLGSNTAGLMMYFGSDYFELNNSATACAIIIAAFGGTWALERVLAYAADKWFPSKGETTLNFPGIPDKDKDEADGK
jgi:hypothetical protein